MLAKERHEYILQLLQKKKTVRVSQLMHALNVTGETIRRDLEYLEKEGQLARVYGGASMIKVDTYQGAFLSRMQVNIQQKEEIANTAIKYVQDGQSLILDHSTTCLIFARELVKCFHALTIVTNSMEILKEVSAVRGFNVIFCGGLLNQDELSCFGEHAKDVIKRLNVDTAFIGVGGVSLREGCTETFYDGADLLRTILDSAQQKIMLVDSSKFDRATLIKVCDVSDIDLFITDSQIKKKVLEKYIANDVEIVTGEVPPSQLDGSPESE